MTNLFGPPEWGPWAYTMLLRNILTLKEVIERLELEYLYRRTGT